MMIRAGSMMVLAASLCLPSQASATPDPHLLPEAKCTSFNWASAGPGREKAALLINATVANRKFRLQLDTGSDVTGLYRSPHSHPIESATVQAGPVKLAQVPIRQFRDVEPGRAQGVIGLDSLKGKRLIIDYPRQRLCDLSSRQQGFSARYWDFIPARLRSGKLFLHVTNQHQNSWHYFWDTGASLYQLVTDKPHWQRLTGRQGNEPDNQLMPASGWGRKLTTVAAPSPYPLMIGTLALDRAVISYVLEQPERFASYPFRAQGLIGNAPFFEHVVLLDLTGSDARFAILRQPDILNTRPARAEHL